MPERYPGDGHPFLRSHEMKQEGLLFYEPCLLCGGSYRYHKEAIDAVN